MSVEDVKQEAWLVAVDIGQRRGYAVDFGDPEDQESVLKWLYCKLVKFAEKQLRHAMRIDKGWDQEGTEGAASALARLLTSPLDSDPLVKPQQAEDEIDYLNVVRHSYSEAWAYVLLLTRFDWDVEELAAHLRVAVRTLRRRLRRCGIRAKAQPSLFDGSSRRSCTSGVGASVEVRSCCRAGCAALAEVGGRRRTACRRRLEYS